jgi:hypothetical protein
MSALFFGHHITINFILGISIVFVSMHQFFTAGDRKGGTEVKATRIHASPSMEHVIDIPISSTNSSNGHAGDRERIAWRPGLPPPVPVLPR